MSKIMENLAKVEAAMKDPAKKVQFGLTLKNAAIEAVMHGIASPQGKTYMSLFADNKDQLTRLTVEEPSDENWFREARAYMVANAICGADSTTLTGTKVREEIDDKLPTTDDGTVVKPFPIP